MGQYYKIAFQHDGERVVVNGRKVEGEGYIMAKLMEHSWMENPLTMAVADEMYKWPMRLLWCGDYAEKDEVYDATDGAVEYEDLWGEDADPGHELAPSKFDYNGKWLVNHDKKLAVNLDEYWRKSEDNGWVICPFPLLTALGNGRGGGDFHEGYIGADKVGTWVWDLISIEDEKPEGYEEFKVVFKERKDKEEDEGKKKVP